ncbi:MAG: proton-conducting transporter membrane subunit, partial [Pseudomonadota bacterium]
MTTLGVLILVLLPALFGIPGWARKRFEPLLSLLVIAPSFLIAALVSNQSGVTPAVTLFSLEAFGLSELIQLRFDSLSALVGTTVLIIVSVVQIFSNRQLREDPNFDRFFNQLGWLKSSLMLLIFSGHLALFIVAWWAVSYFLHNLLLHFSNRPWAKKAATQKFWVSRFGDLFMISFAALTFASFGTLDFQKISALLELGGFNGSQLQVQLAAALLVLGATTKSAQVPFHFWLPNTMETPSPVSALMHAGIINSGGFILVKLAPLVHA